MWRVSHRPGFHSVPVAVSLNFRDEASLIKRRYGVLERRDDVMEVRGQWNRKPIRKVLGDVGVHAGTVRPPLGFYRVPARGIRERGQGAPDAPLCSWSTGHPPPLRPVTDVPGLASTIG